jgi:hypothetical protein
MLKHGLLALLIAATATMAHAEAKKGKNGGMVVTSEGHPIELVLKGQEIVFYINDEGGAPMPTKDLKGRATVQDGGKTTTVALTPAAPNMLTGKLEAPLGAKARVVFSSNLHGHSLTARYVTE